MVGPFQRDHLTRPRRGGGRFEVQREQSAVADSFLEVGRVPTGLLQGVALAAQIAQTEYEGNQPGEGEDQIDRRLEE